MDQLFIYPTRFSQPIPASTFFDRCDISDDLSTYCSPTYNFGIRHVYMGCGPINFYKQ